MWLRQVLKNADDFADTVKSASGVSDPLVKETQNVFKRMESATEPIEPISFWERLKQRKPEFGQRTNEGGWMQQDAEECLTELLNCVNNAVKTPAGKGSVDENFAIEMEVETKLDEAEGGSEEPTKRPEKFYKLACHIQGHVKQADGSFKGATDMLPQGIMKGLEDKLEKTSPSLGRNAIYQTKSRVTRLPKFLMTQLVRFYYKTDTQKRAKVLRPIKFPFMLDTYDFCAPELQAKIKGYRDKKLEKQRAEEAEAKKAKLSHNETPAAAGAPAAAGRVLLSELSLACAHACKDLADLGRYAKLRLPQLMTSDVHAQLPWGRWGCRGRGCGEQDAGGGRGRPRGVNGC